MNPQNPTQTASRLNPQSTADTNPKSTAQVAGHPFHPMLIPFPIAFLVGTLVCDIVYRLNGDPFWAGVSYWLLAAALVMAGLAVIAGFIDFLSSRLIRQQRAAWYHMVGNVTAVALSIANFFVRYANGETGSYPAVMWLSLAVVLLLLFTGWKGWELVYRHHVGVSDVRQADERESLSPAGYAR